MSLIDSLGGRGDPVHQGPHTAAIEHVSGRSNPLLPRWMCADEIDNVVGIVENGDHLPVRAVARQLTQQPRRRQSVIGPVGAVEKHHRRDEPEGGVVILGGVHSLGGTLTPYVAEAARFGFGYRPCEAGARVLSPPST